nr:MAG: hypothetical protein [Bacteriophage sp.]
MNIGNVLVEQSSLIKDKGGRKKAQYYTKRKTEYYCNNCGRKKR